MVILWKEWKGRAVWFLKAIVVGYERYPEPLRYSLAHRRVNILPTCMYIRDAVVGISYTVAESLLM